MRDMRLALVGDLAWLSPFSKMVDSRRPAGVDIRFGAGSSSVDLSRLEKRKAMFNITAPNQLPVHGNGTWPEWKGLLGGAAARCRKVEDSNLPWELPMN